MHAFPRIPGPAAALLLAACSPTAPPLDEVDANDDYQISLVELSDTITKKVFEAGDTNHDDRLSLAEWRALAPHLEASRFAARDLNGDGFISLPEAITATRQARTWYPLFEGLDDDSDTVIDVEEAREFLREHYQPSGQSTP